ncbi:MAG: HupE/UreJ family protein [Gemmatimonadaceae bacterium]
MSDFALYLRVGFHHIADIHAYDHILFVAALTAAYGPREWTRIAWLVTAFTIGHSLTLALSSLDVVRVSARVVEPAIALTIILAAGTAIHDQRHGIAPVQGAWWRRYAIAGVFGLIHGLGFAGGLRTVLGRDESIVVPLLGFNVGLELGQVLIVAGLFGVGVVVERVMRWSRRDWVLVVSGATGGIGLTLLLDRLFGSPK